MAKIPLFFGNFNYRYLGTLNVAKHNSLGSSDGRGISLGDLDGDGDLDAFVTNERQPNKVWVNQGVLPVELTTFTANINGNKVLLNWQTATEVNNYGFEIERSNNLRGHETQNGNSALEGYKKIGFVAGHGNSNSPKEYSFTDKPIGGSKFRYRLKQIDTDGEFEYSDDIEVEVLPAKFKLFQNYPNPFNPTTVIKYAIPKDGYVTVIIYDMLGRKVQALVNEKQSAGRYKQTFNAFALASGIYFYRISVTGGAGNSVKIKKMLLVK